MQADTIPSTPEIEKSILAAILLEPVLFDKAVAKVITETSFHIPQYATIWRVIKQITDSGGTIDLQIIADALKSESKLFNGNPFVYLCDVNESIATTANFEAWTKTLKNSESLRFLLKSAKSIEADIKSGSPVLEIVKQLEESAAIARRKVDTKEHLRLGQHLKNILSAGMEAFEPPMPCGISGADDILRLKRKQLHVLAAQSGCGKTGFCLNAMLGHARAGRTSVLFCGETSSHELTRRLLGICTSVPTYKLDDLKSINSKQSDDIKRGIAELKELEHRIVILGKGDYKHNVTGIRAELKRLQDETNGTLSLAYVDYLQNLRTDQNRNKFGRADLLEEMVYALNEAFGETNVCATLLCQLNRDRERAEKNKMPDICDLKGCSAIEQEADVVTFLHRPQKGQFGSVPIKWYSRKFRGAQIVDCTLEYNTVTCVYSFQSHRYERTYDPE